uniref:Pro-adrenomedullin n=1 Tax=Mola mola TaxID=94237 RepID=A0A3Q3WRU8_MOLML
MRLALHTVICCCVFTTVLPLVDGSTEELKTSLKKRIRALLQNQKKTGLRNSLITANERYSGTPIGNQQEGNIKISSPLARRSAFKSSGCVLVTCAYHDLFHRLYQNNNRQKQTNAPEKKVGPEGYGRRRRRSFQDATRIVPQTGRQSTEAG